MKRTVFLLCLMALLTGCGMKSADTELMEATLPAETVTVSAVETTAAAISAAEPSPIYSQEMAMIDGCVVMQDGDVRYNAENWFAFLEKAHSGMTSSVTVMQYTSDDVGFGQIRYDVSYDGEAFTVICQRDGKTEIQTYSPLMLTHEKGTYDSTYEPYDCYEAYMLQDLVLYCDQIADPDFEGVTEIFLHTKEGEPPVKSCIGTQACEPVLKLLKDAQWIAFDQEEYVYGMKLLMINGQGAELVIELDLNRGVYRYGSQSYAYGEVSDLFGVLDMEQWPESVLLEFASFIK